MKAKSFGDYLFNLLLWILILGFAAALLMMGLVGGMVLTYWRALPGIDELEYGSTRTWQQHLEVYSDISRIPQGTHISFLQNKLDRLEYEKVTRKPSTKGEYQFDGTSDLGEIQLYLRGFRYPRRVVEPHLIVLTIRRGRVDVIEDEDGNRFSFFEMEPELIAELYDERGTTRQVVPFARMPNHLLDAFVAIEDHRFYKHWGVDVQGVLRALIYDIRTRSTAQGASTLTMQLARNVFLNYDQTLSRKIKEALLALKIEHRFSKDEILERYLNFVDLGRYGGRQVHGVQEAAQCYFGKNVWELELHESALLAGIPKSPTLYSPLRHPDRARQRRDVILNVMLERNYISRSEYEKAVKQPVNISYRPQVLNEAPYFLDMVHRQLQQDYDAEILYSRGLRVYTTIDMSFQSAANQAIHDGLSQMDQMLNEKEYQFLAYEENAPGLPGYQDPLNYVQGALIAIEPQTGYIRAMVGGRDYDVSPFNRATQALRQPGSAFKPFILAAAYADGIARPSDIVIDEPWFVPDRNQPDGRWAPKNYYNRYYGPVTLRTVIERSINVAASRFMNERVGIRRTVEMAKRLGIKSKLDPYPSLALGASVVSLSELTHAYATLAAQGIRTEPVSILYVEDATGTLLQEFTPRRQRVLDADVAYQLTYQLQGVFESGTARRLRAQPYLFRYPAAGKTGTTTEYSDAWFIGYTPNLAAGVWVGFDTPSLSIRYPGSQAAAPIWARFMKKVSYQPGIPFDVPPGIVFREIDKETGLLRGPKCPSNRIIEEAFIVGNEPAQVCNVHP